MSLKMISKTPPLRHSSRTMLSLPSRSTPLFLGSTHATDKCVAQSVRTRLATTTTSSITTITSRWCRCPVLLSSPQRRWFGKGKRNSIRRRRHQDHMYDESSPSKLTPDPPAEDMGYMAWVRPFVYIVIAPFSAMVVLCAVSPRIRQSFFDLVGIEAEASLDFVENNPSKKTMETEATFTDFVDNINDTDSLANHGSESEKSWKM